MALTFEEGREIWIFGQENVIRKSSVTRRHLITGLSAAAEVVPPYGTEWRLG